MPKKTIQQLTALIGLLFILGLSRCTPELFSHEQGKIESFTVGSPSSTIVTNATILRAIDGDTAEAKFDDQVSEVKIRLLGVNTPESVDPRREVECFGKEASTFSKLVLEGRRVELREDPQADNQDKYGRYLRNVYLTDGTDVNLLLVERGYAYAYLDYPLDKQRKAQLSHAQQIAQQGGLGLWSTSTCSGTK